MFEFFIALKKSLLVDSIILRLFGMMMKVIILGKTDKFFK